MDVTPAQMVQSTLAAIASMDESQAALEKALHAEVRAGAELTRAKAGAYRKVVGRNREEREAYVDEMVVEQATTYEEAKADSRAFMEKVRNKRQSLSAYQSAMNSIREEATHSRVGPDM